MSLTDTELLGYFSALSNWGRWGKDDRLGTLNHIGPEQRVAAAGLVRHGRSVSCGWQLETTVYADERIAPQRFMLQTGAAAPDLDLGGDLGAYAADYVGVAYHGPRVTHLDALCHVLWDGQMYNGHQQSVITAERGSDLLDVTGARDGIVTRGVLIDAARYRGVDWLEPGDTVRVEEVEAILAAQGVSAEPGDALLLRTGFGRKRTEQGARVIPVEKAGWNADCLPFFASHCTALVTSDGVNDTIPSGFESVRMPIHAVGVQAMGLWLIDNCNLEAAAATCAELGTWEFQFVVSAVPFAGTTGAPVNPLAIF